MNSDPSFGWVYKQKGDPTIQDVRRACAMIESVFGRDELHNLLSRFGTTQLSKLWVGSYRELLSLAARCAEWKHPPSGGWTGDLPNNVSEMLGDDKGVHEHVKPLLKERWRLGRTGHPVCQCGSGYGSTYDGLCEACRGKSAYDAAREANYSKSDLKILNDFDVIE